MYIPIIPKTPKKLFNLLKPHLNHCFKNNGFNYCKVEYDGQINMKGGLKWKIFVQVDFINYHNEMLTSYGGELSEEQKEYLDRWKIAIYNIHRILEIYFDKVFPYKFEYLTIKKDLL